MPEIREGSPVQGVRAPRGLHLRPTLQQETQVRPTQVRPNLLRRTSLLTRPHTVFVLRRAQSPFVTKYTRNLRLFQIFTANRCPTTLCGYVERVWELSSPQYSYKFLLFILQVNIWNYVYLQVKIWKCCWCLCGLHSKAVVVTVTSQSCLCSSNGQFFVLLWSQSIW